VNLYGYVTGDPINWADPSGLKVRFIGPDRNALMNAYKKNKRTRRGKYLCRILEKSSTLYSIDSSPNSAYYDPYTNTIVLDPKYHPYVQTNQNGVTQYEPASTNSMLGHELGHAATGIGDTGPGNMDNVINNENPIRRGLGENDRTAY
jgi:hypothetical protein